MIRDLRVAAAIVVLTICAVAIPAHALDGSDGRFGLGKGRYDHFKPDPRRVAALEDVNVHPQVTSAVYASKDHVTFCIGSGVGDNWEFSARALNLEAGIQNVAGEPWFPNIHTDKGDLSNCNVTGHRINVYEIAQSGPCWETLSSPRGDNDTPSWVKLNVGPNPGGECTRDPRKSCRAIETLFGMEFYSNDSGNGCMNNQSPPGGSWVSINEAEEFKRAYRAAFS